MSYRIATKRTWMISGPPSTFKLAAGDKFPSLTVSLRDGRLVRIPEDMRGCYAVIMLIYRDTGSATRGGQLVAFNAALERLAANNTRVIAWAVASEPEVEAAVGRWKLRFPVGHSADPVLLARVAGSLMARTPAHMSSAEFVLDPRGIVVVSAYTNCSQGRLTPASVIDAVNFQREQVPDAMPAHSPGHIRITPTR
jgi:peroxiredoxin